MSGKEPKECYTDKERLTLFACLLPKGFAGEDVLAEIAPEGWMDSTLYFVVHPTLDHVHWERVQLHRNVREWHRRSKDSAKEPGDLRLRALAQLMGTVLWRPNVRSVN